MSKLPRGIRNNNPGNIRHSNEKWKGQCKGGDAAFKSFISPEYGIRAMTKILLTYQSKYKLDTLYKIISRYAPHVENDTDAYARYVANGAGVELYTVISLKEDKNLLIRIVDRMIRLENAGYKYDKEVIKKGVELAFTT